MKKTITKRKFPKIRFKVDKEAEKEVEDFYIEHFENKLPLNKYYEFLEIVNYIVLNLDPIKEITKWVSYPYPNQEQRCKYLEKVYKECNSMKEFVEKAISYLN